MSDENLPMLPLVELSVGSLPVSLQIFFNDALFDRCKAVAQYIAKAEGMAPRHLIGKPEACFAVVSRALTWRLDPYAVAMATYQTPGGQVGFYGSLCQAIIENSGRLTGGVRFDHYGEWDKLRGKFRIATSERGGKYPAPDWKPEDEIGLGVTVSAKMKDEEERRTMNFDLVQAYPRNSTLWATDPRTQIQYTAVRRFATSTVPTLFMGIPFDREDLGEFPDGLRDVTPPRPEAEEFAETGQRRTRRTRAAAVATQGNGSAPPPPTFFFTDPFGEVHEFSEADAAVAAFAAALEGGRNNVRVLEAYWENGARLISALREVGRNDAADNLGEVYAGLIDEAEQARLDGAEQAPPEAAGEQEEPGAVEEQGEPSGAPAATTAPAIAPVEAKAAEFDVVVPFPEGMAANQWHMHARAKLKAMSEGRRPPEDYRRFREVNQVAMTRLHGELRSWFNMLDKEIARGAQA